LERGKALKDSCKQKGSGRLSEGDAIGKGKKKASLEIHEKREGKVGFRTF